MTSLDRLSGVLFIALVILSLVIAVLGVSVWMRLSGSAGLPDSRSSKPVMILAMICVFVIGFFSTTVPALALLPACAYGFRGFQLRRCRGDVNRDGGLVVLLVGLAWLLLAGIQATLVAWQKTVTGAPLRLDLFLTMPIAGFVSILGWTLLDRLPVSPDWKASRGPMSLFGEP